MGVVFMMKCFFLLYQEIMHALKMTYHVQCFKCAACKAPIRNQAFYMEEGEPYCERGEKLKKKDEKQSEKTKMSKKRNIFFFTAVENSGVVEV